MIIFVLFLNLAFGYDWTMPNTPESGIGDFGSFYLAKPQDFSFHVMNNDFIGNTDKLMTGSSTLFYYSGLGEKNQKQGISLSVNRKLITPIIKTRFKDPTLKKPEGVLADWLEVKASYSKIFDNNWKLETSVSMDDMGDFYGTSIQSKIHQIVGSTDDTKKYGKRKQGTFVGSSIGIGYLFDLNYLIMVYFQKNEIMQNWISKIFYVNTYNKIEYGVEANLVIQQHSDFYLDITPIRYGWGFSLKYQWWQMNFGYVSKYLKYDEYGQFYLDPIVFNFSF